MGKQVKETEVVEEVRAEEVQPEAQAAPQVVAQLVISILDNGGLNVDVPEGMPELQPVEVEGIARRVYDELRDMRVATTAIQMFKSRL